MRFSVYRDSGGELRITDEPDIGEAEIEVVVRPSFDEQGNDLAEVVAGRLATALNRSAQRGDPRRRHVVGPWQYWLARLRLVRAPRALCGQRVGAADDDLAELDVPALPLEPDVPLCPYCLQRVDAVEVVAA